MSQGQVLWVGFFTVSRQKKNFYGDFIPIFNLEIKCRNHTSQIIPENSETSLVLSQMPRLAEFEEMQWLLDKISWTVW